MLDSEYVPFAVQILVSNFAKSLTFYKSLDFKVVRKYECTDYSFATLEFNKSLIMIEEDSRVNKTIDGSNIQLRFILNKDIAKFYKKLTKLGAKVVKPLDNIYYGLRRFSIADPDNYELKFGVKQ